MNSKSHQLLGILVSSAGFALLLASMGSLVLPDSTALAVLGMATGAVCVFAGYLWTISHRAGPTDRVA
jgi:hypothetical protein